MAKAYGMLIGGKWETGTDPIPVMDKYSGETIGTIPRATKTDVERAIGAAESSFPGYAALSAHRRAKILEKISELLAAYQEEIAAMVEAGRPFPYKFGDVPSPSAFSSGFHRAGGHHTSKREQPCPN